MHFRSISGALEEPVSHNAVAKKQVWFRKDNLPPFTQIARVGVLPGEVLAAHAHADMHELFIVLEGAARMIVDGETHELSNPSNNPIVLLVAGWIC